MLSIPFGSFAQAGTKVKHSDANVSMWANKITKNGLESGFHHQLFRLVIRVMGCCSSTSRLRISKRRAHVGQRLHEIPRVRITKLLAFFFF